MRFFVFVGFKDKLTFVGWLKLEISEKIFLDQNCFEETINSFVSAGKKYLTKHLKKEKLSEREIVYVGPSPSPEEILAFEYRFRGEKAHVFFKRTSPIAYYLTKLLPSLAYFL